LSEDNLSFPKTIGKLEDQKRDPLRMKMLYLFPTMFSFRFKVNGKINKTTTRKHGKFRTKSSEINQHLLL